jgi:protein O-mannosyl-transferase
MAKKQPAPAPKPKASTPASTVVPPPAPKPYRYAAGALIALAFLIYCNTLGHDYVLDDPLAINQNQLVIKGFESWPQIITTHYRYGAERATASVLLYRPLSLLAFAAEWAIAPDKAGFGHLMNVLWYAMTVGMVFFAFRRLFQGYHWVWAAGTALLFAVHPIHTEVVANIKSRDEIFAVFWGMTALYGMARRWESPGSTKWLLISMGAYYLALLSKESAVTMLPVFGLAAWFFAKKDLKNSLAAVLPYLVPLALFFIQQRLAFSGIKANIVIDPMDNPIVDAPDFAARAATGFAVMWQYIRLLMVPNPLICDYSYNHFPVVGWGDWKAVAGLILMIGLVGFSIWGLLRRHVLAFFTGAFLCSIILYSQLLIVIGTLFGERLAFAPSVWWCAGITWVLMTLLRVPMRSEDTNLPASAKMALGVCGGIALIFAAMTWLRNPDWHDNLSLFTADAQKATQSVRLYNGIANETYRQWQINQDSYDESGKQELMKKVEDATLKAMAVKPNPVSFLNLGNIAFVNKNYEEAIKQYELSLQSSPGFKLATQNLANVYTVYARVEGQQNNNLAHSEQLYRKAIELGDNTEENFLSLAIVMGMQGKNAEAIPFFEKVVQTNPGNKAAWRNLSVAYGAIGNAEKAAQAAARAN